MEKQLNKVNKTAFHAFDKTVGEVLSNQYVSYALKIIMVLYAAFMADSVPSGVASVLDHSLVRFFIILCIAYLARHDPVLAIVSAIAFVISIQNMNREKVNLVNREHYYDSTGHESFTDPSSESTTEQDPTVHESMEDVENNHEENFDQHESFTGMVPPQGTADGCTGAFFTSDNQLADAQDNEIALSGQNAEVKTWTNQLGPQGTANEPYGHNLSDAGEPAMF